MTTAVAEALRLRTYRPADFTRLCEIDAACFSPKVTFPPQEMRATLQQAGAFTIIAETREDEIAGFIVAAQVRPNQGHVVTVDVLPEFRRRGLGEQLMLAVLKRLAEGGVETVRLETAVGNRAAQALFRKLGFERIAKAKGYYPDSSDAWVMEKQLQRETTGFRSG